MAHNTILDRSDSPGGPHQHNIRPSLTQRIQPSRRDQDMEESTSVPPVATMNSEDDISQLSQALDSSSIHMGISAPDNKADTTNKEVRFSTRVTVVEVPPPRSPKAARVSFSDEVVDIDTAGSDTSSPSPGSPKKRVRFSCLKKGMRSHPITVPIYKMKSFDAISPFLVPKKRVRFGCMKCHPPTPSRSHSEIVDFTADEAETFKRMVTRQNEGFCWADEGDDPGRMDVH